MGLRQAMHLDEWTSPAAIARAETLLEAERALEMAADAVAELGSAAGYIHGPATVKAMASIESAQQVLRKDLQVLRDTNRPYPHPRGWRPILIQMMDGRCGAVRSESPRVLWRLG